MKTFKFFWMKLLLILIIGISISGCGSSTDNNDRIINNGNNQNDYNTTIDNNITENDNNTTVNNDNSEENNISSNGIYVAQSNETSKENVYTFYNKPILYKGKVYTRLFRSFNINVDKGLQIVEYDMSKFHSDTPLNNLLAKTIYDKTVSNKDVNPRLNTCYYNLLRLDDSLYFAGMPHNKSEKSQSVRIKYNLTSENVEYDIGNTPVMGKRKNTTFDLTRGWFVPFDSNSYIAVAENDAIKVFDPSDGSSYKVNGYDYFIDGSLDCYSLPPVATDSRLILRSGGYLKSIKILPDGHATYGSRDTNYEYIISDMLKDFKEKYTGTKEYKYIDYDGVGNVNPSELILDGNTIYNFAKLGYTNDSGFTSYDMYLLKYNSEANLQEIINLQEGVDNKVSPFYIYRPYKYGNNIIFKLAKGDESYICSYNLSEKKYNFKYKMGSLSLSDNYTGNQNSSYIITGDTIVFPEIKASSKSDEYYDYYNLVFTAIDINNGKIIKQYNHKALQNLKYRVDKINIQSSLSDKNSIYFFAKKTTENFIHKMIIKIDSTNNKVIKSQYRMDNQFTGVIKVNYL